MQFRKKYNILKESLKERKIFFFLWPRQVWKTTILKQLFSEINDSKLFLNLEILDYHNYFKDFSTINELLLKNNFDKNKNYYLFLDEFHKVKNIDWIIKSLFDEYENIKIILSWSNNIEINKNIKESFAWRKRIINLHPLDFDEYIIWKEWINENSISNYKQNPLNKTKIYSLLDEFIIWWWYPEVVLAKWKENKIQILADIFSFWFNKDILNEIKESYKFNEFLKHLSHRNWWLININEIAKSIWISQPTCEYYLNLMLKSLLIYIVRPFFNNKLKEIVKMPKIYFWDIWFRNFLINKFDFINDEKWLLFENFVYSELIKKWIYHENIKFWRTKNQAHEIDIILEDKNIAYEIKYKNKIKEKDSKHFIFFNKEYPNFKSEIIYKDNFI